jgi:hypothetical protein
VEIGALVWRPLSVAKLASHGIEWREVEDMSEARPLGEVDQVDEPRPWERPEDTRGWRVAGRGQGRPGRLPLIVLEVAFDEEQSEWLRQEAERTGLDLATILRRLVDHSRAQG